MSTHRVIRSFETSSGQALPLQAFFWSSALVSLRFSSPLFLCRGSTTESLCKSARSSFSLLSFPHVSPVTTFRPHVNSSGSTPSRNHPSLLGFPRPSLGCRPSEPTTNKASLLHKTNFGSIGTKCVTFLVSLSTDGLPFVWNSSARSSFCSPPSWPWLP